MNRYHSKLFLLSVLIILFCVGSLAIPHFLRHTPNHNIGNISADYMNGSYIPDSSSTFENLDDLLSISCNKWNHYRGNIGRIEISSLHVSKKDNNFLNIHCYNMLNFIFVVIIIAFFCAKIVTHDNHIIPIYLCILLLLVVTINNYSMTTTEAGFNDFDGHDEYDVKGSLNMETNGASVLYDFDDQYRLIDILFVLEKFNLDIDGRLSMTFDKCVHVTQPRMGFMLTHAASGTALLMLLVTWGIIFCTKRNPERTSFVINELDD